MASLDDHVQEFNAANVCSPQVTAWVREHGLDKSFYPRVESQISLSGVQECIVFVLPIS